MRDDEHKVASEEYQASSALLQEIVTLTGKAGGGDLLEVILPGIEANIAYFSGMYAFAQGILQFDANETETAAQSFKEGHINLGD